MMINKRLIGTVSESKNILQWCSLVANITMMFGITSFLTGIFYTDVTSTAVLRTAVIVFLALLVRFVCTVGAAKMSYLSSKAVKKTLREMIYKKNF